MPSRGVLRHNGLLCRTRSRPLTLHGQLRRRTLAVTDAAAVVMRAVVDTADGVCGSRSWFMQLTGTVRAYVGQELHEVGHGDGQEPKVMRLSGKPSKPVALSKPPGAVPMCARAKFISSFDFTASPWASCV